MGYYIFSYALDLAKATSVIRTRDPALFDAVLETEEFDLYAGQDQKGYTTTRAALEQLLLGKRHSLFSKYDKASAHAYWYAFIAICGHLGERLPAAHEIKLSYETDLIDAYLLSDFGITVKIDELLLNGEGGQFGLPEIQDWPLCGVWNREQLTVQQDRFSAIDITDEQLQELAETDDEKEMAYDSIRQIKENVTYCLEKQLGMITFCH
ncbi:MAG: hypothetical protein P4L51_22465 [Puia sp.]|nr:hypothetical protein [Puia sp.]